jgi:GH15 family glucan-1,4-alpha-glucosidase
VTLNIEDYAIIGDCETAALVGRDLSVDWLCWPRFDSPACFANLLGTTDNGRWSIAPADSGARITRAYRGHTLILETTIETAGGVAIVTDFMPAKVQGSHLVRLVRGISGSVKLRTELIIRFGYGTVVPWVRRYDDGGHRTELERLVAAIRRRGAMVGGCDPFLAHAARSHF